LRRSDSRRWPAAVLVDTGERLRCFDPDDGEELWDRPGDVVGERFAVVEDMLVTTDGSTVRVLRQP
jgi:hypothetical protein